MKQRVTNFSISKAIKLYCSETLYVLKKIISSLIEIFLDFVEEFILIDYWDILSKLATIVYSLCFKKQTLKVLLDLF